MGRISEGFPLHYFEITEERESQIVPGHVHTERVGMKCPACGRVYSAVPEHGSVVDCPCGAELRVSGNCLTVTIEQGGDDA